jgi:hypothetical protein
MVQGSKGDLAYDIRLAQYDLTVIEAAEVYHPVWSVKNGRTTCGA